LSWHRSSPSTLFPKTPKAFVDGSGLLPKFFLVASRPRNRQIQSNPDERFPRAVRRGTQWVLMPTPCARVAAAIIWLFIVACASHPPAAPPDAGGGCDAGTSSACTCPAGTQGARVCDATGSGWGDCLCGSKNDGASAGNGDAVAGVGVDATADAPQDATVDTADATLDASMESPTDGWATEAGDDEATAVDAESPPSDAGLACGAFEASSRQPAPHSPDDVDAATCAGGPWAVVDGVCCAQYCSTDNTSDTCVSCGGPGSATCAAVNSKACVSGQWPEVHALCGDEPWHYSRSTHFGLTYAGACNFGLYGLCTPKFTFADSSLKGQCDSFCAQYPDLCADPADGGTLRGNFAAPNGNYYTQFWPSLPGDDDNYLSCGECFELVRTLPDGGDYDPTTDSGYTPPIVLQIVDSCPCAANSKWCCGSGRDHCGEVSDFKYGCPLPPGPPPPPVDHDPLPNESIHLDLSDIAMARLQTGDPNGMLLEGVIPTRYRRVPCPVTGDMYAWLHPGAGQYYFALSIVNVAGLGSVVSVEAQGASGAWISLQRDPNYTAARPQERSGDWVLPQGAVVEAPVSLRVTDPSGRALVAPNVVPNWGALDGGDWDYVDLGIQF
jgi:hypothetical protein